MTISEITAYVMALPVEDVRRLTATEIMGYSWPQPSHAPMWCPDIDRNQSRMVTDKVPKGPLADAMWLLEHTGSRWYDLAPIDESRAALIAHMIHAQESKNDTNE